MTTPTLDSRIPDALTSRISDIRLPEIPDFEPPRFDLSTIDVGKAMTGAAAAIGLVRPRRSRRKYAIGFGIVAAVAAVALMNSDAIRDRLTRAKAWVGDHLGAAPAPDMDMTDMDSPRRPDVFDAVVDEYADGLGVTADGTDGTGNGVASLVEAGRHA